MAVTTDITESWLRPRRVIRRKLDAGVNEGRALAVLMGACALIFVSQAPRLSREAHLAPEVPLDARMGATLFALIFVAPLMFYAIAGLSHLIQRAIHGRGTAYGARLALFWALLATTPLMLLHGLMAGFIGPGPATTGLGLLVGLCFAILWGNMLIEAAR